VNRGSTPSLAHQVRFILIMHAHGCDANSTPLPQYMGTTTESPTVLLFASCPHSHNRHRQVVFCRIPACGFGATVRDEVR
jgi:hypothetical protein